MNKAKKKIIINKIIFAIGSQKCSGKFLMTNLKQTLTVTCNYKFVNFRLSIIILNEKNCHLSSFLGLIKLCVFDIVNVCVYVLLCMCLPFCEYEYVHIVDDFMFVCKFLDWTCFEIYGSGTFCSINLHFEVKRVFDSEVAWFLSLMRSCACSPSSLLITSLFHLLFRFP